jgi:hypothetical protein
MRKYIIISILSIITVGLYFAGTNDRTRALQTVNVFGQSSDQSYLVTGGAAGDTLVVSDTIQIPIVVNHSAIVKPQIQMYWQKIGSGTATITASFWESNDGTNYTQILKGKAQGAYTKTLTLTATGTTFVSFPLDTAILQGRFLKIRYITSSTASVKGKMTHRIKFNL